MSSKSKSSTAVTLGLPIGALLLLFVLGMHAGLFESREMQTENNAAALDGGAAGSLQGGGGASNRPDETKKPSLWQKVKKAITGKSGGKINSNPAPGTPKACTLDNTTVASGATVAFYSTKIVLAGTPRGCEAVKLNRTCTDGKLSGNDAYRYATCSVRQ